MEMHPVQRDPPNLHRLTVLVKILRCTALDMVRFERLTYVEMDGVEQ